MNSLYNLALRQSSSVHTDLALLEATSPQSSTFTPLAGQLTVSLSAFGRTIDDYESMAKRELSVQKREKALQRVKKFREEEREMRSSLSNIKSQQQNAYVAPSYNGVNSRANNYTHTSTSTVSANTAFDTPATSSSLHARYASQTPSSPHAASQSYQGALPPQDRPDPLSAYRMNASAAAMFGNANGEAGFSAREGFALREHSFIQQTESQLDSFIAQGREVWTNLTEQRDILKGTQRRLRDVGVTLGLSRNVIGYIERRSTQDNIIFLAGAIFTLICFFYIYKWFG